MTIKFSAYGDVFFVRCDLTQASATVQQSCDGKEWGDSQYQCADTKHTYGGLVEIGRTLYARAYEMPVGQLVCEVEVCD